MAYTPIASHPSPYRRRCGPTPLERVRLAALTLTLTHALALTLTRCGWVLLD